MDDERRVRVTASAVRASERGLAALVDVLVPGDVALADAAELWKAFDCVERLAANAKTLLAARVEASGTWRRSGARSAAEHLAKLGGTTTGVAKTALATSRHLRNLPDITDALQGGVLSSAQVDAIAPAAAADPSAERRLLVLASTTNVTELREECLRTRAAADPDRDATHRRIHVNRCNRTYTDAEGAWNLAGRGTADTGARFEAALEPIINEMFTKARVEDRREARAAYAYDALMSLAERRAAPPGDTPVPPKPRRSTPRFTAVLRLDVQALTRGKAESGETCEIVGVGPVPVAVARELLGEAVLHLVITKGVDVATVVHLGRGPTAAQRIALLWSKPKCANAECSSMFVQIDHRVPWVTTKHTRLDELDPLCPHHHRLKTNEHWSLVEGTGRRAFVPPEDPRHPRNRPPPDSS